MKTRLVFVLTTLIFAFSTSVRCMNNTNDINGMDKLTNEDQIASLKAKLTKLISIVTLLNKQQEEGEKKIDKLEKTVEEQKETISKINKVNKTLTSKNHALTKEKSLLESEVNNVKNQLNMKKEHLTELQKKNKNLNLLIKNTVTEGNKKLQEIRNQHNERRKKFSQSLLIINNLMDEVNEIAEKGLTKKKNHSKNMKIQVNLN